jgi:hypothetical protein
VAADDDAARPITPPGAHADRLRHVRPVDLRRALLAVLLTDGGPVSLDDVIRRLEHVHRIHLDRAVGVSTRRRVSDMLRYQVRAGRAVRVARGVYAAVPQGMSRSTVWRCLNWERVRDRTWDAM